MLILFFAAQIYITFRSNHQLGKIVVSTNSALLILYFSPIPQFYRYFKEIIILSAYIISIIVYESLTCISSKLLVVKNRSKKIVGIVILVIFLGLLLQGLISPVFYRFSSRKWIIPPQQKYQTLITDAEYDAALFIRASTPKNAVIISDSFTMWVLAPLSNRIWIVERSMNWKEMGIQTLTSIKNDVFSAPDSRTAYENLHKLSEKIPYSEVDYMQRTGKSNLSYIIIISVRTSQWVNREDYLGFQYTLDEEIDPRLLNVFLDPRYFTLLYKIDGKIYVFMAK
ncbi:MAG: hypothetical protein QXV01_03950 [Candidatus Bathyarchaeia archaeon]